MSTVGEKDLDVVRAAMRSARPAIRAPSAYDKVCNDECAFSFDTPYSPEGLYVSLGSFQGFGQRHVALDHQRTGNRLYVHLKWTKTLKPTPTEAEAEQKPTKLAIGGESGFAVGEDRYDITKDASLVCLGVEPWVRVPLPNAELPELIIDACRALIEKKSHLAEASNAAVAWELDVKPSRYAADLVQLPPTKKISPDPKDWVCEESGMRENLWLNLSDGHIGSGRRQWDGSGGTNGALNHYEVTRTTHPPLGFPLVVKLGTITPHGADVYSYAPDENNEVTDPKLAEHLAHWGINMMVMEKTTLSVEEVNIAANEKLSLDKITEAGKDLAPLQGAGHVGLKNLGNSCYMNSVLQALFATPELGAALTPAAPAIFASAPEDASSDLLSQLAKLADGLLTERYAEGNESETAVCVQPRMFKALVGKNHPEFSSARQQDAQEYLGHLLSQLERMERTAASGARTGGTPLPPFSALFGFVMEDRIEVDGMACYKTTKGVTQLLLSIPLEAATNKAEVDAYEARAGAAKKRKLEEEADPELAAAMALSRGDAAPPTSVDEEPVVPIVPLDACLQRLVAPTSLDNFRGRAGAVKTTKLASFPRYLMVTLQRYYTSSDWQAKKLSCEVPMPTSLDLTAFRSSGPREGEALLPDDDAADAAGGPPAPPPPAPLEPDETIVAQLLSMGFSENGCKRAALAVQNANAEAAAEWVFAHMEDPDFNEPLPPPAAAEPAAVAAAASGGGGGGGAAAPDPEALLMLGGMGFTEMQAQGALAATGGSLERAADWLFSHSDDLDAAVAAALGGGASGGGGGGGGDGGGGGGEVPNDGGGQYELLAIISHMGSNTSCGHYVCHVRKDGQWALFNDQKVAVSEEPPLSLGYMYLYQRTDA